MKAELTSIWVGGYSATATFKLESEVEIEIKLNKARVERIKAVVQPIIDEAAEEFIKSNLGLV